MERGVGMGGVEKCLPCFLYAHEKFFLMIALAKSFLSCRMFSQTKQQTTQLWMWRMEYLHHEQRPLYFGEWF
jgi:hypothetical protein